MRRRRPINLGDLAWQRHREMQTRIQIWSWIIVMSLISLAILWAALR